MSTKSILKKAISAGLSVCISAAPVASQVTTAITSRAAVSAVVGLAAITLPGAANAQSGKRMCSTVWTVPSGRVAFGMEVSKYDPITCIGLMAGWLALTSLPSSLEGFARAAFNNAGFSGSGATGRMRPMETCEQFSQHMSAPTNDVCLQMQDYRIYMFARAYYNGGGFFLKKI